MQFFTIFMSEGAIFSTIHVIINLNVLTIILLVIVKMCEIVVDDVCNRNETEKS